MGKLRTALVFNGGAGGRDLGRRERIIERIHPERVIDIDEGSDVADAIRGALDEGVEAVVAAGGDGTVSSCAGLVGSRAHLGILPCGTSNSIARALGIPEDLDQACDVVLLGGTRSLDVAHARTAEGGEHTVMLLASIGFHATTVGEAASATKSALGKLAYVVEGIARLADLQNFAVTVETERGSAVVRAMAVTLANLAPRETIFAQGPDEVIPDDGLLDLTIASAESALDALAASLELAVSALRGREVEGRRVGWVRCRRARLVADPPQRVLVDGEIVGTTPLTVEILPAGLTVLVP